MNLLVTGGAGYVGSVCTAVLIERGHDVTVVDDLSTGNLEAVHPSATFIQANIADVVDELLTANRFDGVLHFAARSLVGESVECPDLYWHHNVVTTLKILDAMRNSGTKNLVFSSTAATYGEPETVPIKENAPTAPTNPYGATKLAIDAMITSYAHAYGLAATSLRYFNVAGAYNGFGENREIETHLIPLILQVALGQRDNIKVFGTDWPTADGTCIRDYIHILDLAEAHILALGSNVGGQHRIFNLGSGEGYSVLEVIEACREVTGHEIPAVVEGRRAGDPAVLIASSEKAQQELGWNPKHTDIQTIVKDAWEYTSALGDALHSSK